MSVVADRTAQSGEELVGLRKDQLDTPVLLLDLDRFERNCDRIAGLLAPRGVGWRPHQKAHKSPAIAKLQIAHGAFGVTCAKSTEAEVMALNGIGKILIANQVVTPQKLARIARLQRHAEVIICVDQPANVDMASAAALAEGTTIPVAVETNVGMDRAGVEPGEPVLALARQIDAAPGLRFAGIMGYEGHLLTVWPAAEKERACREAMGWLIETRDLLVRDGLEVGIVSAGGSGTYMYSSLVSGVTEMEAGGGCFMDRFYVEDCHMDDLEVSMTVLATVTSRPTPTRGITDAGFKTISGDEHLPSAIGLTGVEVVSLSAEHGELRLAGAGQQLTVGDQVEFMLGYSDTTAYHHDRIIGTRNGIVTDVFPMLGRGKLA